MCLWVGYVHIRTAGAYEGQRQQISQDVEITGGYELPDLTPLTEQCY